MLDMSHKYKSSPEPIESISELELRARQFSDDILSSANDNTYTKGKNNYICNLPQEIKDLIKLKKRLQRYYSRTDDQYTKKCYIQYWK